MVPSMTILRSNKGLRDTATTRYWTLSDTSHTIHFVRVQLTKSVEMKRSAIVLKVVGVLDFNNVSPPRLDQITWQLSVDDHGQSWEAIRSNGGIVDCQLASDLHTGCWPGLVVVGVEVQTTPCSGIIAGKTFTGDAARNGGARTGRLETRNDGWRGSRRRRA